MKIKLGLFILLMGWNLQAQAVTGESKSSIPQPTKQIGTYVSLGNPFPSLLGLNAAYNFTNDLRGVLGYGEVEVTSSLSFNGSGFEAKTVKATTYSAGGDYLFTDWTLRPLVGARLGYFDISGSGDLEVQGFSKSTFLISGNAGFDWVTGNGTYLGTGLNVALVGGSGTGFYANFGYFF